MNSNKALVFLLFVQWRDSMMRTGTKSSPALCPKLLPVCEDDIDSKLRMTLIVNLRFGDFTFYAHNYLLLKFD